MYQGKHIPKAMNHSMSRRKRRLRWRKEFVLVCSVLVLLLGMVGGTVAYLITNTESVINTFTPPENEVEVTETFDREIKKNVQFKNNSDFSVRIRATYIANWVKDGQVYPAALTPNVDFEVTIGADWDNKGDGYWLYKDAVAVDGKTTDFIVSLEPIDSAAPGDDYHLEVEVICESIQAEPSSAMNAVWGY